VAEAILNLPAGRQV